MRGVDESSHRAHLTDEWFRNAINNHRNKFRKYFSLPLLWQLSLNVNSRTASPVDAFFSPAEAEASKSDYRMISGSEREQRIIYYWNFFRSTRPARFSDRIEFLGALISKHC